jgi:predicted amidophosphoribosyltransferase
MKCPDCHEEIRFHREYCPHCSASLFGKNNKQMEKNLKESPKNFWALVGII